MGTQRTKSGLQTEINSVITTGLEDGITGATLNELLDDFTESLLFNNGNGSLDGDLAINGGGSLTVDSDITSGGTVFVSKAGAGDVFVSFSNGDSEDWTMGIDDTDSDSFKISNNSALGTSDAITISITTLNVEFGGNISISKISGDVSLLLAGGDDWVMGVDATDSDSFKIDHSTAVGGDTVFKIDSSKNAIFPQMPTASAGLPSGALWSDSGTIKIIA